MKLSFWERESFFSTKDFVIVGSGLVGLNAAICLKEKYPKASVIILERGPIPSGASTRNAGFACFGSVSELLDDLNHSSETEVFDLVERRWRGLMRLQERTGAALAFNPCGGYEIFKEQDEALYELCASKIDFLNKAMSKSIAKKEVYQNADSKINSFGFKGAKHLIYNQYEGHIHTGNMMKALLALAKSKGIEIYNGLGLAKLEESENEVQLYLENGWTLKANHLIVATNGFAPQLFPKLALKPARNQVLITEPIPNLPFEGTFHYDKGYYYFRNVGNRILFGGGRNLSPKQEETDQFGFSSLIKEQLLSILKEVILPNQAVQVEQWWSGILGVGAIKKPIIEQYSKRIVIAVRMGGMGVAIGSLVGEEAANLL